MRLFEMCIDAFNETTLAEMASSRKAAKTLVTSLSPQIIKHFIKLYVFNSPENKNGWIREINAWLADINDIYLKPSNKKPEWDTIYNWMIYDSAPHYDAEYVNDLVELWKDSEFSNVSLYDYDAHVVLHEIFRIIELACKDISIRKKFVGIRKYLH